MRSNEAAIEIGVVATAIAPYSWADEVGLHARAVGRGVFGIGGWVPGLKGGRVTLAWDDAESAIAHLIAAWEGPRGASHD